MRGNNKMRGSVSILLAIVMVPMLTLGGVCADIAAIAAARSETEAALALAIHGMLSDYQKELYEMYGLFAMPQTGEEAAIAGLGYLEDCMEPTTVFERQDLYSAVQKSRYGGTDAFSGLSKLTPVDFSVEPVSASSPANPTVLENQILSFMKLRGPLVLGENVLERFSVLDSLETKAETASAKLKHDDALQKADEAARALHEAANAYFASLHSPFFQPGIAEGIRAAYTEDELLLTTEAGAWMERGRLQRLQSTEAAAKAAPGSVDSAALLRFAGEELRLKRDAVMRTLPRRLVVFSDTFAHPDPTSSELSEALDEQTRKVGVITETFPEILEIYSSALAVKNTVEKMTDAERTVLSGACVDCGAALETAEEWISSAEYLFKESDASLTFLQEIADGCRQKSEALEKAFTEAVKSPLETCGALETAAGTLLAAISDYEACARTYAALLEALPEDSFKENLVKELEQYKVLYDSPAVRNLQSRVSQTKKLWETANAGLGGATASAFEEEAALDASVLTEDTPAGRLLADYAARYKGPKQEGDKSLLQALKKLAAKESKSDDSGEISSLKTVTEGDIHGCFAAIDGLCRLSQVANTSELEGFSVGGEDSSDSDISENTASGMHAVASFFSGFGKVLADIGDDLLEVEYLCEMFSCAADDPKTAVSLTGKGLNVSPAFGSELEYLIFGNENLAANKTAAIATISAIRFVTNLIFAYSNSMTQSMATAIATSVAGWTGFGIPIVRNVVLICWTIAETAADMKCLLDGEGVAIVKTKDTWQLSPQGLKKKLEELGEKIVLEVSGEDAPAAAKNGKDNFLEDLNQCTYRDYLTLLLVVGYPFNKTNVLNRCAKLIQINVSMVEPAFRLPGCWTIAYAQATASVNTLFLGGAVTVAAGSGDLQVDFRRLGEGTHEITVSKMAAY